MQEEDVVQKAKYVCAGLMNRADDGDVERVLSRVIIDKAAVASSPEVGSSEISAMGIAIISRAMQTRLRSPPDIPLFSTLPVTLSFT